MFGVPEWGRTNDAHHWRPTSTFFYARSNITSYGFLPVGVPSAEDNLVMIPVTHPVTWAEANEMANQQAGGLPTQADFSLYLVKAEQGCPDMWMPASRADGQDGEWV